MNSHPYLRAFLAGAFVPTLVLPLLLTAFIILRLVLQMPFPFELMNQLRYVAGDLERQPFLHLRQSELLLN